MTTVSQPIKRHGGKSYQAKWIVSHMPARVKNPNAPAADDPGYIHYVEPYFGGGSVLFASEPEGISEVVNDIDSDLSAFWQVLRDPTLFKVFETQVNCTPFSEVEYEAACRNTVGELLVHRALAFFIRNRQSRQALEKDFATLTRNRTRKGMNEQVSSWLSAIEGLWWFHERLKRVVILNRPALDVIKQQDGPRTLFYLDPPYMHETRSTTTEYGAGEMTEEQHWELVKMLSAIKGRFLLSGYHSTVYDDIAFDHNWKCHELEIDNKASSSKTKERKIECLWTNY